MEKKKKSKLNIEVNMQATKKFNMPENMLSREQYSSLPPQQKEEYLHNFLKDILRLNTMGLTISDVKKNTYISRTVIWHHLEILASRGEFFRMERGDTDVYHLNNVIDHLEEFDVLDDKSASHFGFNFDLIENPFGKFLRIQRMRESRTDAHTIRAGVLIPHYFIEILLNTITKIKETRLKDK